ncbi:MAG: hypothetical protein ACU836_06020 [Gammaproteobacteria bacterium]
MRYAQIIAAFGAAVVFPSASNAAILLSNGELEVAVRSDNGAIDKVNFGGTDWYNPGSPISDWGLQIGGDSSTFRLNPTQGGSGISIATATPSNDLMLATIIGTYSVSGNDVAVTRNYSILNNVSALQVVTTLTNDSSDSLELRLFDTYDPDQGFSLNRSYDTYMDVTSINVNQSDLSLGQAWIDAPKPLSVSMGSTDPGVIIASGGPFSISNGDSLNGFFASPSDADASFVDLGMHVGFSMTLSPGESKTVTLVQVYGDTPTNNISDFETALTSAILAGVPTLIEDEGSSAVPLPTAWPLFLSSLIFWGRFRDCSGRTCKRLSPKVWFFGTMRIFILVSAYRGFCFRPESFGLAQEALV